MGRSSLSRPVSLALNDGILQSGDSFFDYGCGRGDDIRQLATFGFQAYGWDPAFRPDVERIPSDVVNFGYVANVIEDPVERADALRAAWQLTKRVLIVAARVDWEARGLLGKPFGDGIITSTGTFQKFYSQEELRSWLSSLVNAPIVTAAPGIFYIFRDAVQSQSFLSSRVRRRTPVARPKVTSEALYEVNREVLAPLEAFVLTRGRLPEASELVDAPVIIERLGSIRKASDLVRQIIGESTWLAAERDAREDFLVYLALSAFGGRPKYSVLPPDLQLDVRAFFNSYKESCTAADQLLFAAGNQNTIEQSCRTGRVGKLTPAALYIHISALGYLPPVLRVYEGCGRALTGTVEGANIIKLNRIEPKVTYLSYPDFDRDPHPALAMSIRADLRRLDVKLSDFRSSMNPPILHRKELFVSDDYPRRAIFARLTVQEERAGLFDESTTIGTREGWQHTLSAHGVRTRGHQLIRTR